MWTCTQCGSKVEQLDVSIETDANEGCYFECPACKAHNPLLSVGGNGPDDALELIQSPLAAREKGP